MSKPDETGALAATGDQAQQQKRPWLRRPEVASPNGHPRPEWLSCVTEPPLFPELEIVDAHHHLWDREGFRYLLEEFADDIGESGHRITASVFVQCRTMFRADGPDAYRPVGEVEFVRGVAAQARSGFYGSTRVAAAIVGGANLLMGTSVAPVLEDMAEAGGELFRGVRVPVASHPDPDVRSNPVPAPRGLMVSRAFVDGARELARRNLTLDIWAYQTQLDEVETLARQLPDLQIVVNHAGGPLGVGPYAGRKAEHQQAWRKALSRLATLPNVALKVGGFGMPIMGFGFDKGELPPDSRQLADAIRPYVDRCVSLFGADRCMFESNFPVDKGSFSYGVLWNAFQRIATHWSDDDRHAAFAGTAKRIYRLFPDTEI